MIDGRTAEVETAMTQRAFQTMFAAAALAAGLTVASAASAAAVVFTQTYDLTTANVTPTSVTSVNNTGFTPTLSNGSPLLVSNGDSIDFRVNFASGQGLMFTGSTFGLFQIAVISPDFIALSGNANSTLTLFDTSGNVIRTLGVNNFTSTQPRVLGDTFGNIGVPLSGTIGSLEFIDPSISGLGQANHFTSSVLSLDATSAGGFQVVSVAVTPTVPEPATWAMLVIGFGGLGAMLRRRRAPTLA
jgi:hypothetical protein